MYHENDMPIAGSEVSVQSMPDELPRKRWTRVEFEALEALEPFRQQRLELIEGDLIQKMPKHRPHVNAKHQR